MSAPDIDLIASLFMLKAVQEWGQTEAERVAAVQGALDAAGFKATATCGPVFGAIWPKACEGEDAEAAAYWLKNLTDTMQRGDFHAEKQHVAACIREARGEAP